ncbi:MAG TPA: pitrilysin family protein, partial [Longimicrobium sp.]|nr:pitrilysin family protein [Longimicrobium sp.]
NVWYHVGSGYERPGRTGFAHLFEHIMFEGSKNVPEGDFDNWLEAAGARNNGSTTTDRTNYYEVMPSNAVELALWLEADRMGGLLDAMSPSKLEGQRGVVQNERRQNYENQPYGLLWEAAPPLLYPAGHPYSWTTIGSMADLEAAELEDVNQFFRTYYAPNNASIAVVGDVNPQQVRQWVERYFGWIPRGQEVQRPQPTPVSLAATTYTTREDRVSLPQLNMIWHTGPRFSPDEAAVNALVAILTDGKSSRLNKRLVYDEQVAAFVQSFNDASLLAGEMWILVRAKPDVDLDRMEAAVDEEVARLAQTPPSREELDRVINGLVTNFVGALETVEGKAERLNHYLYYAGDPGFAERDLARYRALTPADIQRVARQYLDGKNRVVISIVPQGRTELGAQENQ